VPITIESLASGNILCYRFTGVISEADLVDVRRQEPPHFEGLPDDRCISIIADMTGIDTIAPALFPQLHWLRLVSDHRVCVVAVAGANPYLRALTISLVNLTGRHAFIFCNTFDEALSVVGADSTQLYAAAD
jgi:hypothetical protein